MSKKATAAAAPLPPITISVVGAGVKSRGQVVLDRLLEARNALQGGLEALEGLRKTVGGGAPGGAMAPKMAAAPAEGANTEFFPALERLAEEFERLATDVPAAIAAIAVHF